MKAWSTLLSQLDVELGSQTVSRWLRPLKILKFDAANLYLDAVDSFQISWFKEYVAPILPKRFVSGLGKPIKIHFTIQGEPLEKEKGKEEEENALFPPDPLEPHATFESFLSGEDKHLPYTLLKEIADGKQEGTYNPIYLYGPKGTGKSHLLMATANALQKRGTRCFYIRADTFTDHVIRAFRSTSLQEFRKVCREIEVLLIDDVHLFARKNATQEELFHTFNRLHTSGLQIILSSKVPPRGLEEIEERLISRFEWGITLGLPVQSPSLQKEILNARAASLSFPLDPSFAEFLLETFKNPHSLIQALEALALRLPHLKSSPDVEIAKYHLSDLILKESKTLLTAEKLLKIVANSFGIKVEDILGKSQSKECALPRQIAMYLFREKLQMSFLKVGRLFSRDHSTVMTSVKRVKKALQAKEEKFILPLSDIEKILN